MALSPIIFVGAGVLSLSTVHSLISRYPGTPVLIIAAELPTDSPTSWTANYASMWAGAHYRPIAPSSAQLQAETVLARETYAVMKRIARDAPESAVGLMMAVEYMERPGKGELQLRTGDDYAGPGDRFRVLGQQELPEPIQWGCEYETYCLDAPAYCRWLLEQVQKMGALVVRQTLPDAGDAFIVAQSVGFPKAKIVVNCSGRGFADPKSEIIRGQTVLVKQQYHQTVTRQCADGSWTFLIPRPNAGGTIVGGTKEVGDWDSKAREETRAAVLEKAVQCFPYFVPEASQFKVVRDNVGRRPWREGGLRMDTERLEGGRQIVHGYGAGGRGFELSWGVASRLVQLVEQASKPRPSL